MAAKERRGNKEKGINQTSDTEGVTNFQEAEMEPEITTMISVKQYVNQMLAQQRAYYLEMMDRETYRHIYLINLLK